jgi:membrane protein insertase Oxa1/YidC/SpoIIIJ
MPLFLGMYQTLRAGVNGARFLWVETLARPDPVFAILAALTTMLNCYSVIQTDVLHYVVARRIKSGR